MFANERILVVEDDDDIRDVIQEVLASEGLSVDVARDGQDALDKLDHSASLPIILLDMMMPKMDGETFVKALRARPAFAGASVVVISGSAGAREKARELSAAACLVKPFELDELLGVIRRITRNGSPRDASGR